MPWVSLWSILVYVSMQSRGQFLPLMQTVLLDSLFGTFIYPYSPWDLILILSKFFQGKKALGSRSLKLQASREPAEALASKEHFASFPLVAQKALWYSSTLSNLLWFIFDN